MSQYGVNLRAHLPDTYPFEGLGGCTPTGVCNSFTGGCYSSAGGMGCQVWGTFDGLPAELRRSVSGRIFLEQPLDLIDDHPTKDSNDGDTSSPKSVAGYDFAAEVAAEQAALAADQPAQCLQD